MNSIRLTPLFALPVAVSLILGAIARDAQAGICNKRNLPRGCVNSADVANRSLGTIHLKDEAGLNFSKFHEPFVLTTLNSGVAFLSQAAPRKGWVIATASTTILGTGASSKGVARCEIGARLTSSIGVSTQLGLKPILGSVNTEKGAHNAIMAATLGFEVPKGNFDVFLRCRLLSGGPLKITGGKLVVQYYPTEY